MNHIYLSFKSDDPAQDLSQDNARRMMSAFFNAFSDKVTHTEAAKIDEVVYANSILDPRADRASITIAHTFFGCFEVISLLTTKGPIFLMGRVP